MYLLLTLAYRRVVLHIPPLIPFSAIINILKTLQSSSFSFSPDAVRKQAGSSSYISRLIFRKFLNTSTNHNV